MNRGWYYAALVLATLAWGVEIVVGKYAVTGIGAFTTLFVECGTAAAFLWVLMLLRRRRTPRRVPLRHYTFLGWLEPFVTYGALNVGLLTAAATDAALLLALLPVIVLVLGVLFAHERVGIRGITGALISTAGAVVLTTADLTVVGGFGDLFILLANFGAAGAVLVVNRLSSKADALEITAYQFGIGFLMTIPVMVVVWLTGFEPVPGLSQLPQLLAAAAVGVGAFAIAYLAYNYAVGKVSVGLAGVALNLIPLFGVVSAVLFLGETVGPTQWIAGALLLGGLALFPIGDQGQPPVPAPSTQEAERASREPDRQPGPHAGSSHQ